MRGAAGPRVKEARHAFLAGAGVALDEDSGVAARDSGGKRHEMRAGGIADRGNRYGPGEFGDQGKGKAHVLKAEGDTGRQAIGGSYQRWRAVDQADQDVAMRCVTDLGRQQHAAAVLFTRALRIDDTDAVESIFEPVLQPGNERADPTAHVKR